MAKSNVAVSRKLKTHGGGAAFAHLKPLEELRRAAFACMLFEDQFYESGSTLARRVIGIARQCKPDDVAEVAIQARSVHNLRHLPLLLTAVLVRMTGGKLVSDTVYNVVQRADELAELLAVYARVYGVEVGKIKSAMTAPLRKGLARAFTKFSAYSLAKYNRDGAIKLRDVMFLTHPKPVNDEQAEVFKKLAANTLESPDTWEVALSGGGDKKEVFTRLLAEKKLGYMALLRNLRGMSEAKVDPALVKSAILERRGADRVLPFRYLAAARHAPEFEREIDKAMIAAFEKMEKLPGHTIAVIDISGSMEQRLSGKSEMTRKDAACALAAILSSVCESVSVYATAGSDSRGSHATALVPPRKGMAMIDAVAAKNSELGGGGIFLTQVMNYIRDKESPLPVHRVIVFTDEQDCDRGDGHPSKAPLLGSLNYMVNVASYDRTINFGNWIQINGFSESVIKFILAYEQSLKNGNNS